jgi:RNA polymerase sigma factor (TIGR02999 family)
LPQEVTQLLVELGKGNDAALDQLLPLVYAELRRMARRYMGMQNPGHTLQPTALIHEAYVRLIGNSDKQWVNRAHFFGVAAKSMRHVLVDHARAHRTAKRGGQRPAVPLEEAIVISGERREEILALDDALTDLAKLNPRQSSVVELRYFGGLSVEETAEALHVSPETVMRDWRAAKAWLYKELARGEAAASVGGGEPGNDA